MMKRMLHASCCLTVLSLAPNVVEPFNVVSRTRFGRTALFAAPKKNKKKTDRPSRTAADPIEAAWYRATQKGTDVIRSTLSHVQQEAAQEKKKHISKNLGVFPVSPWPKIQIPATKQEDDDADAISKCIGDRNPRERYIKAIQRADYTLERALQKAVQRHGNSIPSPAPNGRRALPKVDEQFLKDAQGALLHYQQALQQAQRILLIGKNDSDAGTDSTEPKKDSQGSFITNAVQVVEGKIGHGTKQQRQWRQQVGQPDPMNLRYAGLLTKLPKGFLGQFQPVEAEQNDVLGAAAEFVHSALVRSSTTKQPAKGRSAPDLVKSWFSPQPKQKKSSISHERILTDIQFKAREAIQEKALASKEMEQELREHVSGKVQEWKDEATQRITHDISEAKNATLEFSTVALDATKQAFNTTKQRSEESVLSTRRAVAEFVRSPHTKEMGKKAIEEVSSMALDFAIETSIAAFEVTQEMSQRGFDSTRKALVKTGKYVQSEEAKQMAVQAMEASRDLSTKVVEIAGDGFGFVKEQIIQKAEKSEPAAKPSFYFMNEDDIQSSSDQDGKSKLQP